MSELVRMGMSVHDAAELADRLAEARRSPWVQRTLEQLWLRSILVDQRRRTRIPERSAFEDRADSILAALDPDLPGTPLTGADWERQALEALEAAS